MEHAKCRSCGASIVWVVTDPGGMRMPVDAKAEKRFVLDPLAERLGATPSARLEETYVSHFATCPNAAQHRKPRLPGVE